MVEWVFLALVGVTAFIGVLLLLAGLFGYAANGYVLLTFGVVELGLLIQAAVSVGMSLAGARALVSTLEFFGYLLVAIFLPLLAVAWALAERNKWSTVVLGFASLTITVMLFRMWQIWTGSAYL